ncbi:MAG: hypothetical protein ABI972_27640 [Acidobacteriota bacterium]
MNIHFAPLAALLATLPLAAEFHVITIRYTPSGCIDCAQSLEARLRKTRGVEDLTFDPNGVVTLRLAPANRVRLELIRDFIEQGGEKINRIEFEASGALEAEGEARTFVVSGVDTRYPVTGAKAAAPRLRLTAHTDKSRPLAFTIDKAVAE